MPLAGTAGFDGHREAGHADVLPRGDHGRWLPGRRQDVARWKPAGGGVVTGTGQWPSGQARAGRLLGPVLIARCSRPSWIQRVPQLEQKACGCRLTRIVMRADAHNGHLGMEAFQVVGRVRGEAMAVSPASACVNGIHLPSRWTLW